MSDIGLSEAVALYLDLRKAMGQSMRNDTKILQFFCRMMGAILLADVPVDRVQEFLAGTGPVTLYWHRKHQALNGFFRFAIARNYVTSSPLPTLLPARPAPFAPHIFTLQELQRLLDGIASFPNRKNTIPGDTLRVLLLLLYGTGLRISEALALTLNDVDLSAAILTIRDSKFYKTRLVPIGPRLQEELMQYGENRKQQLQRLETLFFLTRHGTPISPKTVDRVFGRLRRHTSVCRTDGTKYQPRLHDLRHTFAVHRLVAWYQQGADVQKLLPRLATYLGHVDIQSTQHYLTMTPDLLREASLRFERYAVPGSGA
jgi:site-specific recombinase XerD